MCSFEREFSGLSKLLAGYHAVLRSTVLVLACISGAGIFLMMAAICIDVLLRRIAPLVGVYDVIKVLSPLALASAIPYTTAVKGHVAVEFFFQKLNRPGRIVVDSLVRVAAMTFFVFLSWRSFVYGCMLHNTHQTTQTLQIPLFWIPHYIGVCCIVVVLVIGYNLAHPGREMIKP